MDGPSDLLSIQNDKCNSVYVCVSLPLSLSIAVTIILSDCLFSPHQLVIVVAVVAL